MNILIVDDTLLYRNLLTDVLEEIPNVNVIGTAANGVLALEKLKELDIQIVLLDVEMPGMDGLETLKEIRKRYPSIGIIMVSGVSHKAADITILALENGALDFVPKPRSKSIKHSVEKLRSALTPILSVQATKIALASASDSASVLSNRIHQEPEFDKIQERNSTPPSKIAAVAIGVSTGGPRALAQILPQLPQNFKVPVFVVQHMPEGFTRSLASQLDRKCRLKVKEAQDGDIVEAGNIFIAPGGRHMVVRKSSGNLIVEINDNPPVKSCRPSVDVFFRSLAKMPDKVLTAVLTGMGEDGLDGVKTLTERGSYNLVQNKESSVVFGMPKMVAQAGLADEILPLDQLVSRIIELGK